MFWRIGGEVSVIPLGGVDYVGHNCFLYEYGNYAVVVDCGVRPQTYNERKEFEDEFGAPNPNWTNSPPRLDILDEALEKRKKVIGVITHAHLDHIGAVRELALRKIPVHLSDISKLFLDRYDLKIPGGAAFYLTGDTKCGNFDISFFPMPHSIPGNNAVLIRVGGKTILHLGDFKFNGMQDTRRQTSQIFREIRRQAGKIDCLTLDVLNIDVEGFTPPERLVLDSIEKIVKEASGRVIITFFASNTERMKGILNIAKSLHKTVGIAGWGMNASYSMIGGHGLQKNGGILLIGGSQGEENSGLTRMALGEHKYLQLFRRDTVVDSSRGIPGNEEAKRMNFERIHRIGSEIILHEGETAKLKLSFKPREMLVHVSGHEQKSGLLEAVEILQPEIIIPFHAPPDRIKLFKEMVGPKVKCLRVGERLEV